MLLNSISFSVSNTYFTGWIQAWCRNKHVGDLPYIAFLHGNVAIGYDAESKRSGPAGMFSKKTYNEFVPTRLLYPVSRKDYNSDPYIKSQWDMAEDFLASKDVARFTVFGYGAPQSDIEAIQSWNSLKWLIYAKSAMLNEVGTTL